MRQANASAMRNFSFIKQRISECKVFFFRYFFIFIKFPIFKTYIDSLSNKGDWKIAKKFILKKKLDLEHYPKIKHFAELSFFNFYFNEFTWQQCEERFSHKSSLLIHLVESLYANMKKNEAFSIIKRHNLLKELKTLSSNEILNEYEEKKENFDFQSNILIEKDQFSPYEVAYEDGDENNFIKLKDYGINENDVLMIDNEESLVSIAKKELFSSKIVFFIKGLK